MKDREYHRTALLMRRRRPLQDRTTPRTATSAACTKAIAGQEYYRTATTECKDAIAGEEYHRTATSDERTEAFAGLEYHGTATTHGK
jgi:hypothetical protein